MTRPTHDALIQREQAIGADAPKGLEYAAICADRKARWAAIVEAMSIAEPIRAWAARMAAAYGPTVRVWANDLDWPTALLVVRYGEAESFWPETFSAADLARAAQWEAGVIPQGVVHYRGPQVVAAGDVG